METDIRFGMKPLEVRIEKDIDDKTVDRLASILTPDDSLLPIERPQNMQLDDGVRNLNIPSTDLEESAFISSSLDKDLGEDQGSLNAYTIQEYSTDSGYGSPKSRHPITVTRAHKPPKPKFIWGYQL
jgi:hypothetical protein